MVTYALLRLLENIIWHGSTLATISNHALRCTIQLRQHVNPKRNTAGQQPIVTTLRACIRACEPNIRGIALYLLGPHRNNNATSRTKRSMCLLLPPGNKFLEAINLSIVAWLNKFGSSSWRAGTHISFNGKYAGIKRVRSMQRTRNTDWNTFLVPKSSLSWHLSPEDTSAARIFSNHCTTDSISGWTSSSGRSRNRLGH